MLGRKRAILALVAVLGPVAWFGVTSASASGKDATARHHGWPSAAAPVTSAQEALRVATSRVTLPREGVTRVFISEEVRAADIDVGESGESPGDFFVFEEDVFETSGKRVGRDSVRCELRVRSFACEGTVQIFGKGKIEISGALFSENDATIPVTGGTGVYEGVGGTLRVLDIAIEDPEEFRTALIFHPVY